MREARGPRFSRREFIWATASLLNAAAPIEPITVSVNLMLDRSAHHGHGLTEREIRKVLPDPFYKTFLGLNDANADTLPHEYAHHFCLDTRRTRTWTGNFWADVRNNYWLARQRRGTPIPAFRVCATSDWAKYEVNPVPKSV